jgi:hypothetical protein
MLAYRTSTNFGTAISPIPMARGRAQQIRGTNTWLKPVGCISPQIPMVLNIPSAVEGRATVVPSHQAKLASLADTI